MANATANKTTGNKVLSEQKKNRIFEVLAEGIPFVDKSVTDLADEYLSKYHSRELAAKKLINNQILIVRCPFTACCMSCGLVIACFNGTHMN